MATTRTTMATVPESSWNNANTNSSSNNNGSGGGTGGGGGNSSSSGTAALLNFVSGSSGNINNNNAKPADASAAAAASASRISSTGTSSILALSSGGGDSNNNTESWSRAGRQFAAPREIYTRALYRLCLKFTTSEDEDEGKPEPATAYWTLYGRTTTIGNAGPTSSTPDSICRRMDDSMTGPAAGVLSRLVDADGEQATALALRAGMTSGWYIRGDRGDAAVRVGKAKVFSTSGGGGDRGGGDRGQGKSSSTEGAGREAQVLSLDADRWILCKGASFAAGNSVFNVEDCSEAKQKITIHCSKGPMRGKLIDIHASRCPYVFGRAHEADLCIMDRELSRRHGAILHIPSSSSSSSLTRNNNNNGRNQQQQQQRGKSSNSNGNFILVDLESTVSFL
jgi:hypothetical protein